MTAIMMVSACTDDITEGNKVPGAGIGTGEMVLFTSGTTQNNITTRADGDGGSGNNGGNTGNDPTGVTYYMPLNHRFVCRMYYKAAAGDNAKYDVKGGTDVISWFKVGDNAGNSLYWRNSFIDLDPNVPSNFDVFGNDAEATCFYWQNRKEHAFLAWTDLNHATTIGYSPDKNSNSLKFVPADVDFEKHTGEEKEQWVDNGYEVCGVDQDFADWEAVRTYMETGDNYEKYVKDKVPTGINPEDFKGKTYYYAYGWSCKYSEAFSKITTVDQKHQKIGWVQYQMYYDKLPYNGPTSGDDLEIKRDEHDKPIFLFNKTTNKYLAEIEVQSDDTWKYNLTDEYGNVKFDETNPRYTFYYQLLQEYKKQEVVNIFPANEFDLTRKPEMQSINDQPDICQALTKQAPLGATQTTNRVNLYFKHQFSQIQVNVKTSADLSVVVNKKHIQKVELLGVTEKGYVFTEINEDGEVEKASYESVDVSKFSDDDLKKNQYGTAFSMFDMATGKDENGKPIPDTDKETHDAGYPLGYIKSYNGIAFGLLQAIRITWNENEDGSGITHESTYKVADNNLRNLRSGCKYIWNIELRRGTLAIVRTEIVDWIVNGEGGALEYNSNGTISN